MSDQATATMRFHRLVAQIRTNAPARLRRLVVDDLVESDLNLTRAEAEALYDKHYPEEAA